MRRVDKPWGYEIIWAETDKYVGKFLVIKRDHKLSRQYHIKKDETFFVQNGLMDLEIGPPDNMFTIRLTEGQSYHCPPGTIHRMIAISNVVVIEVSTPELDDVVRVEDDYGRQS